MLAVATYCHSLTLCVAATVCAATFISIFQRLLWHAEGSTQVFLGKSVTVSTSFLVVFVAVNLVKHLLSPLVSISAPVYMQSVSTTRTLSLPQHHATQQPLQRWQEMHGGEQSVSVPHSSYIRSLSDCKDHDCVVVVVIIVLPQ